jgi:hypothetical protein
VIAGLLSFAVSVGLSALREPLPRVHDEFSYLLAADTFASGRLSNPTHPCWVHFETFHVLQQPRYASKYPPAQGLFLAAGQAVAGRPIVGAWLGVALGSSAVCWMLQGWTRPRWALVGGLLTALHPGVHGGTDLATGLFSWSQSYWGGGPAMIGGALLFGALPRLARRPGVGHAVAMAVGLALLANSRPFEGLLVTVPALIALGLAWRRAGRLLADTLVARVVVPASVVLLAVGVAMASYNRAVTCSPWRMPYAVYEAAYNPIPIFASWSRPGPVPEYRHDTIRGFFTGWVRDQWLRQQTPLGWWAYHERLLTGWLWPFFVGPLALPFLSAPVVLRRSGYALLAGVCLLVVAAHLTTVGIQPHYAAPAFGCFMTVIVESLRRLAVARVGSLRVGRALVGLTIALVVAQLAVVGRVRATAPAGWEASRAAIDAALSSQGGKHLIIVRYGPDHDPLREWVYNRADIDRAPVVWARETTPALQRGLLSYFGGRSVWLLDADADPPHPVAIRDPLASSD